MTIDRITYARARREGLSPVVAAYAARPPVIDSATLAAIQESGWAFDLLGRRFWARWNYESDCLCPETDGMTPEEYDRMDHGDLAVILLEDDGETDSPYSMILGSVCLDRSTTISSLLSDRWIDETIGELARECIAQEEARAVSKEEETEQRNAAAVMV